MRAHSQHSHDTVHHPVTLPAFLREGVLGRVYNRAVSIGGLRSGSGPKRNEIRTKTKINIIIIIIIFFFFICSKRVILRCVSNHVSTSCQIKMSYQRLYNNITMKSWPRVQARSASAFFLRSLSARSGHIPRGGFKTRKHAGLRRNWWKGTLALTP